MDLIELQNRIHKQNVELGWWDEERSYETQSCLFHSELSEAMEGDRKGLMDDHLPHYEMFWVEVADFVIRLLDYLGKQNNKTTLPPMSGFSTRHIFLDSMHKRISQSSPFNTANLKIAIAECFEYMESIENTNLHFIILEKVEYNKNREDHKKRKPCQRRRKKY